VKFENIEMLIDDSGEITIGRVGPVRCAAAASDENQCLAMLVRRPDESFEDLLARLDGAIADAVEDQIFVDEING
jgi:ABC-type taurine transport system substrate-binding protein